VQPIPTTFTDSHWLTAENLELVQTWSGDTSQMKVGEPLTRTVKLVAHGSTVGQLPELNSSKIDPQLKAYNDQPVLHEDKTLAGIVASREEKIAFIPAKAGDYTLPAIQISWFNTRTQKTEMATLPEMSLTVVGVENAPQVQTTPVVEEQKQISTLNEAAASLPPLKGGGGESEARGLLLIWQSIAIFSTIGWLITLVFLFFKHKNASKKVIEPLENPAEISLKTCIKQLKNACMTNDANAAKNALLEWGRRQFDESSLGAIAPHCEARLRDEILKLNASLYAKNAEPWQGKELFKTFSENNARAKLTTIHTKDDALKPLYRL
jgi:hypothetical protein